jgi:hypothetical protein
MEVRNIFNAYANGLSKVSLDNTTFLAIKVAGLKEAVRRMDTQDRVAGLSPEAFRSVSIKAFLSGVDASIPVYKAVDSVKNAAGLWFEKFIINGVEIFYRFDNTAEENKHSFYMNSVKAKALYVPYTREIIDLGEEIKGFVTVTA